MEKIILPKVRDLGQIVGDSFLFARENFKLLIRFFILYVVPLLIVAAVLFGFGFKQNSFAADQLTPRFNLFSHLNGLGSLGYFLYLFVLSFQHLFITEYVILKEKHDSLTIGQVLSQLKADIGTIIVTVLLLIVVIMIVVVAGLVVIGIASVLGSVVVFLVAIPLFVLFIYAAFAVSNVLYIRLRENLDMSEALNKCFRLIRGYWWRSFIASLVVSMIFYGFVASLVAPFSLLVFLLRFHSTTPIQTDFFSIAILGVAGTLGGFAYFFTLNIIQVFVGINYFSLSEQCDSYHLKAEINEIGQRNEVTVRRQEGEY